MNGRVVFSGLWGIVCLCVVSVVAPEGARAATLNVPGDYPTVQAALDAAAEGDEIVVAPGAYPESLQFRGPNVVLRSTDPLDPAVVSATVLNASMVNPPNRPAVVIFSGQEGPSCRLAGFTVLLGGSDSWDAGGGISGNGTRATIENCVIQDCVADFGGAIGDCNGLIRGCVIERNRGKRGAGGLYRCQGEIRECQIRENVSESDGGAFSSCNGLIVANEILNNQAARAGGGLYNCAGEILNNTLSNNTAESGGGLSNCAAREISGNRIQFNKATQRGGGLYSCWAEIRHNEILENEAGLEGGGIYGSVRSLVENDLLRNRAANGGGLHGGANLILDNDFVENEAQYQGGGLWISSGTVTDCLIEGNRTGPEGQGGGVYMNGGTLYRCWIKENSSQRGGGVFIPSSGDLSNCFFSGNTASLRGGALQGGKVENCTFVKNRAPEGSASAGFLEFWNSIAWDNPTSGGAAQVTSASVKCARNCIQGWDSGGEGNITDDPKLIVNLEGSETPVLLSPDSPCIDQIDPWKLTNYSVTDGYGNTRLAGDRVDMGCVEFGGAPDADADWLADEDEVAAGTDPANPDSDGDGLPDGHERLRAGGDPAAAGARQTLLIPEQYPTILQAMFSAYTSETLSLAPGEYREPAWFTRNFLTLTGRDPRNAATVAATRIVNEEGLAVSIRGDGIVRGLTVCDSSRGIAGGGSDSRIDHCVIRNNVSLAIGNCAGVVANNVITSNTCSALLGCDGVIMNNLISYNRANLNGGGLHSCNGWAVNNTIVNNSAGAFGGGLYRCFGLNQNNILWGNSAPQGPQIFDSNIPGFCLIEGWDGGGPGIVTSDPRFVDPANGNFDLAADSPAIDAGRDFWPPCPPWLDLNGELRLIGPRVDIGCQEYGGYADDGDLMNVKLEKELGLEPGILDSDGDGIVDGMELLRGTNPVIADSPGTIRVPEDLPLIQTALAASMPGDEIVIAPGIYQEILLFPAHDLTVRGGGAGGGATSPTVVLDGAGMARVVTLSGKQTPAARLADLTVRGGRGPLAGAIHGFGNHATLENLNIERNDSLPNRVGSSANAAIFDCDGLIRRLRVAENTSWIFDLDPMIFFPEYNILTLPGDSGGGLLGCDGRIEECEITCNGGGGITSCGAEILRNLIRHNQGSGISGATGRIEDNHIEGNAGKWGGGINGASGPVISNRLIANRGRYGGAIYNASGPVEGNRIERNTSEWGGGLYQCPGAVRNNLFLFNSSLNSGAAILYCGGEVVNNLFYGNAGSWYILQGCRSLVRNNIFLNNMAYRGLLDDCSLPSYCCIPGWTGGGVGNLTVDPALVDPAGGDFRLSGASPCIDAGGAVPGLTVDYLGLPRPVDFIAWPLGDGSDFDIGPYEVQESAEPPVPQPAPGPPALYYVPQDFATIQEAINAAAPGDVIVVSPGEYHENLHMMGKALALISTNPRDPAVVEATVLRASSVLSAVTCLGSEGGLISGLTITGGGNTQTIGGGINANGAPITIEYNVITGNQADFGGGIANLYGYIRYNTISRNRAVRGGGGLYDCFCPLFEYNVVAFNETRYGGGTYMGTLNSFFSVFYGNQASGGGSAIYSSGNLENCIVWGNTGPGSAFIGAPGVYRYSLLPEMNNPSQGVFSADPLFANPAQGDFHLLPGSPAIDAGDPSPRLNDACQPPALGSERADLGIYGGPGSCGHTPFSPREVSRILQGALFTSLTDALLSDWNLDGVIDAADLIHWRIAPPPRP